MRITRMENHHWTKLKRLEDSMRTEIDDFNYIVADGEGNLHVTRQSVTGGVATHVLKTGYSVEAIAAWIEAKVKRPTFAAFVQDAFPDMPKEDREFLLTGVTPAEWNRLFPPQEEEDDDEQEREDQRCDGRPQSR